jgi:hypothetical protein
MRTTILWTTSTMSARVITTEDMPMTNVVHVDFRHRCKVAAPYPVPDYFLERFQMILRDLGLEQDDIEDVLEAITDPRAYARLDPDLAHIVDVYNEKTEGLFQ